MAKEKEVTVKFSVFNREFAQAMKENTASSAKLSKEFRLISEQLKLTGTDTDQLSAKLENLKSKQELAQQRTQMTSEQLEKAKALYGENSVEVQRLEKQLLDAQTAEQKIANEITITTEKLEAAKAASSDYAKELTRLKEEEDKLKSEAEKASKQLELQKEQLGSNSSESKKLDTELSGLAGQYDIARNHSQNLNDQLENAKKLYGENSAEVNELEKELLDAQLAEQKFKNEIEQTTQAIIDHGGKLGDVGDKMQEVGEKTARVGSTMTRSVTVPILGAGAAALTMASNFEAGMSEVEAISGATGEEMEKLEDLAKEMGESTRFSATEAAEALKYMAMAGWDSEQMIAGLPAVLDAAAASGEELGLVSDIVTDGLTAFGMQAEDGARFADVLATASNNANTNISMLGESFKYVAPVAGAMGYSIEDTAVALGLMANAGIKSSQAGTTLRGALNALVKPSGEAAEIMDKYNLSLTDAEGNMLPFRDVLGQLRGAFGDVSGAIADANIELVDSEGALKDGEELLKDLEAANMDVSQAEKIRSMNVLFGRQAMAGMLSIINTSEEDYGKLTNAIDNSSGAAKRMAEVMQDNLQGRLIALGSKLEGVAIKIGNILIPYAEKLVGWLSKLVTSFSNLDEATQTNIIKWAGIAAAVGPVLLIFGKLTSSIGSIIKLAGSFGTAAMQLVAKLASVGTSGSAAAVGTAAAGTSMATATPAVVGFGTAINTVFGVLGLVAAIAGGVALAIGAFKKPAEESADGVDEFSSALSDSHETMRTVNKGVTDLMAEQATQVKEKYGQMTTDVQTALVRMRDVTGEEIEAAKTDLNEKMSGLTDSLVSDLDSQISAESKLIQDLMANTSQISEEEGQAMIQRVQENGEKRKENLASYETQIQDILQTSLNEQGQLTEEGMAEILEIQRKMLDEEAVMLAETANAKQLGLASSFFTMFNEINQENWDSYKEMVEEAYQSAISSAQEELIQKKATIEQSTLMDEEMKEQARKAADEEYDIRVSNAEKIRFDSVKSVQDGMIERVNLTTEERKKLEEERGKLQASYEQGYINDRELAEKQNKLLEKYSLDTIAETKSLGEEIDKTVSKYGKGVERTTKKTMDNSAEEVRRSDLPNAFGSRGRQSGESYTAGLENGIRSGESGVFSVVNSIANAAVNAWNQVTQTRSPSRVMMQKGRFFTEGIALGVLQNKNMLLQEVADLATDMTNEFTSEFNDLNMRGMTNAANVVAQQAYNNNVFQINATVRDDADIRQIAVEINKILGAEVG